MQPINPFNPEVKPKVNPGNSPGSNPEVTPPIGPSSDPIVTPDTRELPEIDIPPGDPAQPATQA